MNAPAFVMDEGWLEYHPNPSRPEYRVPPGAVDAHCHVFGPGDQFPFAPERSLLLQNPIGQVPHGGGKRLEADGPGEERKDD